MLMIWDRLPPRCSPATELPCNHAGCMQVRSPSELPACLVVLVANAEPLVTVGRQAATLPVPRTPSRLCIPLANRHLCMRMYLVPSETIGIIIQGAKAATGRRGALDWKK